MADEVTSHNIGHLSICVRFLDQQKEDFFAFVTLERIAGEAISQIL